MAKKPLAVLYDKRPTTEEKELEPIFEAFAKKIGANIRVNLDSGRRVRPPNTDKHLGLTIHFYCLPVESEYLHIDKAYGLSLERGQRYGCDIALLRDTSWGKIVYDTEGSPVAAIVEKNLYILFDLPCEVEIWRDKNHSKEILEFLLADYYLFRKDPVAFDKLMLDRGRESAIERLGVACQEVQSRLAEERLNDLQREIRGIGQDLAMASRGIKISSEKGKSHKGEKAALADMYQRLCKLADGEIKISSNMSRISLPVGQIDIKYKDVVYDIGSFTLEINTLTGYVMCRNTTRTVGDEYHHPHIDNAHIILGDAQYGLVTLLGKMDLETVIAMIVDFLRSYDPETALKDIKFWPVKEERHE